MAHPSKINSSAGLAFILGALCVVVLGVAYALFARDDGFAFSVEGEDTTLEKAAEAVSDS
jgi:hypothetical protein